jgi:replicative DNA helicase
MAAFSSYYDEEFTKELEPYFSDYEKEDEIIDNTIIREDGTIAKISELKPGDKIHGDDHTLRTVISCSVELHDIYQIDFLKIEKPLVVSGENFLILKCSHTMLDSNAYVRGNIVKITPSEYINSPKMFRHHYRTYCASTTFKDQKIVFDPYIIGCWLGDGHHKEPIISNSDQEMIDEFHRIAPLYNLRITSDNQNKYKTGAKGINHRFCVLNAPKKHGNNQLINAIKKYNMYGNKHIPYEYKINSRENMLELLAGLIDSDGSYSHTKNNYHALKITQVRKSISKDIFFIARSLGFTTVFSKSSRKEYKGSIIQKRNLYHVAISGSTINQIPIRIARKKPTQYQPKKCDSILSIKKINYIGKRKINTVIIDGNHKYVNSNFIVMHDFTKERFQNEYLIFGKRLRIESNQKKKRTNKKQRND